MKKKEQWILLRKGADFERIARQHGIDPLTALVLRNRNITDDEAINDFLNGTPLNLPDPHLLKGVREACDILRTKIAEGRRIRIAGDYDIDGIMSTYILHRTITALGGLCDEVIPHRVSDGYGLNIRIVREACEEGIDTLITCDNGISAFEQIEYAKKEGLCVILTDHHDIPFDIADGRKSYKMPAADVIINPKQPGETYPVSNICGAQVAWKLSLCLLEEADRLTDEIRDELLVCAAIAAVGDIMELTGENRILVREGLAKLKSTTNIGLAALVKACGLNDKEIGSFHVGFVIGPCINAVGRLDSASRGLELLKTDSREKAAELAGELKELNEQRKNLTAQGVETAVRLIENKTASGDKISVIFLEDCHESLAGIIAGRIREMYGRPTFVFTRSGDGIKGSGRSVPSYHMYDGLCECATLFSKFGGHAMAAGLSMPEENLPVFRKMINDNCSLSEDELCDKIYIDAEVPFSYFTLERVKDLGRLKPFGNGNGEPLFACKNVKVLSGRVLGSSGRAAKYRVKDENGGFYELMYFGDVASFQEALGINDVISVCYYPSVNEYMGRESVQLVIKHFRN